MSVSASRRSRAVDRVRELADAAVGAMLSPVVTGIAAFNRRRLPPRDAPHPMLTGLHEPMANELTLEDPAVDGTIPSELDGRYV